MSRSSPYGGNYDPNQRRYVTLAPDAYIKIMGDTAVQTCAECGNKVDFNDYVTSINTTCNVDSAPGTANFELTIPDTDRTQFYQDGRFIIVPMMEIEIYAKGYFLIGGVPQYYKIFWGLTTQISQSWSNGSTRISIGCKDILYWWDLTLTTINPSFLNSFGGTGGNYQLLQNQFAGSNPYAVIIQLAQESMGDWSLATGSLLSFIPEEGKESAQFSNYSLDLMTYWQNKFSNIWNNLTIYGATGQAYTFPPDTKSLSPNAVARAIIDAEDKAAPVNGATRAVKTMADDMVAYKPEITQAGNVSFFASTQESKMSVAKHVAHQLGYEFYCDTTGDIVFKPPFYNLNVLPNKPTSWVQNFEIISDDITEDEGEVVTHLTASGTAFDGKVDWGVSNEFTTPRTGVVDYHLARRYGWRRQDYQVEWAGDPKKLFFHLIDYLDRINSKRTFGNVTIPMRPELRLGFPVYIPKYDCFYYVAGISHQYAVGSTASTTLQLTAKRGKFVAPSDIGTIKVNSSPSVNQTTNVSGESKVSNTKQDTFTVNFPSNRASSKDPNSGSNPAIPLIIRDPKTGKVLGYPNAVMVFEKPVSGKDLGDLTAKSYEPATATGQAKKGTQNTGSGAPSYDVQRNLVNSRLNSENVAKTIQSLRTNRYEVTANNAGYYNYAHDVDGKIKDLTVVPAAAYFNQALKPQDAESDPKTRAEKLTADLKEINDTIRGLKEEIRKAGLELAKLKAAKRTNLTTLEQITITTNEEFLKAKQTLLASAEQLKSGYMTSLKTINSPPTGNYLIRPVSDEFGFELIGHYRYGRGLVIDTGQVKVKDNQGNIANELSIQFSPSNNITSTNQVGTGKNDPNYVNFQAKWEQMQPEDWVTGASFVGNNDPNQVSKQYSPTSAQSYTDSIKTQVSNSVYVEADALRRAKTLVDLGPSIDVNNLRNADTQCACALSRANWLTILPSGVISAIISNKATETDYTNIPLNADVPNKIVTIKPDDFFNALNGYMGRLFSDAMPEYMERRRAATQSPTVVPDAVTVTSGNSNTASVPIYTQAASGSAAGQAVLANNPNLNFGLTTQNLVNNQGPTFVENIGTQTFQNASGGLSPSEAVPGTPTVIE